MDTDHYRGWLGFSLSNHQPYLLEALSSAQPHGGKLQVTEDERPGAAELAALAAVGPKMEDFLSGARGKPVGRLAGGETTDAIGIYGSELKNIATGFLRGLPTAAEQQDTEARKAEAPVVESRRVVDALGQRTSIYRGVTRHRWTGRYEAHLWDNSCRREGQSRKGRQVYLGGYDKEEKAARAYDLAALKYWGPSTTTNFLISNYETEMEGMKNMTRLEFVASLRRAQD